MKINYFYGSIAIRLRDGYYTENLDFNVAEGKGLTFRYPYGDATPEEAEAISQFIKTVTNAYNKLTTQIDNVNKDLKLEQYASTVSAEETTSESAVPQTCALGDEEVSKGTDGETKTLAQQVEDDVIESLGLK